LTALKKLQSFVSKHLSYLYHVPCRIDGKLCKIRWLHDKVINMYMYLLQQREKSFRNRFWSSFFLEKMFDAGRTAEREGIYCYEYVKRWKGAENLFTSRKVIMPLNYRNVHWLLFVANIFERRIEYVWCCAEKNSPCMFSSYVVF